MSEPTLNLWNLPELLERIEYDRTFLAELLTIFHQDSLTNLNEAKSALASTDFPTLERRAHTLKGMFRNLLMNPAAQLASDLELAARQHHHQTCAVLLTQLESALQQLLLLADAQAAEVSS